MNLATSRIPTRDAPAPHTCTPKAAVPSFLVATEDGTIVGWNSNLYPTQALCLAATAAGQNNHGIIKVDNSKGGAVYKGLAVATDKNGTTFLYVTNFHAGQVETTMALGGW